VRRGFTHAVGGKVDGWDTGDHLAKAAQRAGLSHDELERSIAAGH